MIMVLETAGTNHRLVGLCQSDSSSGHIHKRLYVVRVDGLRTRPFLHLTVPSFVIDWIVIASHQSRDSEVKIEVFPVPEALDCIGRDLESMPSVRLLQALAW